MWSLSFKIIVNVDEETRWFPKRPDDKKIGGKKKVWGPTLGSQGAESWKAGEGVGDITFETAAYYPQTPLAATENPREAPPHASTSPAR